MITGGKMLPPGKVPQPTPKTIGPEVRVECLQLSLTMQNPWHRIVLPRPNLTADPIHVFLLTIMGFGQKRPLIGVRGKNLSQFREFGISGSFQTVPSLDEEQEFAFRNAWNRI
jgi:hypothetical protein